MEAVFFYIFGAIAVVSAAYVIIAKNPINGAISLIGTFLALAGVYVLLNAHFLAVIQVLVYAGAIMVLFLFVIMLLNLRDEDLGPRRVNSFKLLGAALTAFVLVQFIGFFLESDQPVQGGGRQVISSAIDPSWGGIVGVGRTLFRDYLLPFEIASILLLAAMIGALLIAKKRA